MISRYKNVISLFGLMQVNTDFEDLSEQKGRSRGCRQLL